MTQTSNIGLKKIDGSENWRQIFDYHNDSADKTDGAVAAVQDGLAIVANGNTHAAVAEGQFVYVRNHSTLAEGLYKASAAIGTNATLSTSNLTADGSGGLNDLQEQVTSLNSKLIPIDQTYTGTTNASGLLVTNIPFTRKILNVSVVGPEGFVYCQFRSSTSSFVTVLCTNENGVLANKSVTVYVYSIG